MIFGENMYSWVLFYMFYLKLKDRKGAVSCVNVFSERP